MARILLDLASPHVRLALRIYFNVILPLLGLIGDQCCKKRSQLRLLRKRPLEITHMTGWLRGTSAACAMYSMRRSPAGWLGFVMVLAGLYWLIADLVVSALVVPVNVVDRCPFNTTGPYQVMPTPHVMGPLSVGPVGTLFDIITGAQKTSKANGGLTGIFNKSNTDPLFRADAQDILGQWECRRVGKDSTYPFDTPPLSIVEDLVLRGLMYDPSSYCPTMLIGKNQYIQMLAWSSSVSDWSYEIAGKTSEEIATDTELHLWNVLAAVDLSTEPSDDKVMRSFNCTMNAPAVEFVLGKLQGTTTLSSFCLALTTNVYGYFTLGIPPVPEMDAAIASTLDTMIMMAGAYGAGVNKPPPSIPDETQGCFAVKTEVPGPVIIVFILVTATALTICAYWLLLIIQIKALRNQSPDEVALVSKDTPNGLLGWMKQAVCENGPTNTVEYRNFRNWTLAPSREMLGLRLIRKDQFISEKDEQYWDDESSALSIQTSSTDKQPLVTTQEVPATRTRAVLRKPVQCKVTPIRSHPPQASVTAYGPIAPSYSIT
ncbi:hypothetical protein NA57DRAFT_54380 [Rhizodiscina lignyota]|uniref:Uncharacterized protein n=1 Tax=Rhizodiscina lignyota TaxID=1504668 RepID=A0A9P4IG08_9PEZI|nr:hypothetical protein NA57DRAFT_54380 [Rhizodiscina lignyota]